MSKKVLGRIRFKLFGVTTEATCYFDSTWSCEDQFVENWLNLEDFFSHGGAPLASVVYGAARMLDGEVIENNERMPTGKVEF